MSTAEDMSLALVPAAPAGMVLPVATIEDGRAAIAAFEQAKTNILLPRDVVKISGREHIKRSGWDRIARFFGVSVYPVSEEYQTDPDGTWGYAVVVKAVAPNGAMMIGDGMCWSSEKKKGQDTRHNVRAHAYTRATNRAISNLVGGGEVSAEELNDYVEDYTERAPQPARPNGKAAPAYKLGSDQDALARLKALDIDTSKAEDIRAFFAGRNLHPPFTQAAVNYALTEAENEARTVDADPNPASDPHDLARLDLSNGRH